MKPEPVILASREQSSMVSSWVEYLCLRSLQAGESELFTGRYEALTEAEQFLNEETGNYDLPAEIDGQKVVAIEDDYVVGGELGFFEADDAVAFRNPDEPAVAQWLKATGWSDKIDQAAIRKAEKASP
jgi:hypothetical protein